MIYGYIRVSTDKQTTENQRFEILKYADEKKLPVDAWMEETISATKKLSHRKLGALLAAMQPEDVLLVTELSRLGRSLLEVMSILHTLMEKEVKVFTTKERYELGNNISSKVLAFAFSLSAEIERSMISSRTKEALVLRFIIDVRVMLPPLGRGIGHLRAPFDGPRSLLTMRSVWYGQTSTGKAWDFDSKALRTRPAGAGALPSR